MPSIDFLPGVVRTFSGRAVDVVRPQPDMFFIEDIARGLAMQTRYNGQILNFYSVAEHSFYVSTLCGDDPKVQLAGLLHDAAEAYLGDMAAPIKHLAELAQYRLLERRVMAAISVRFGLPLHLHPLIGSVDQSIRVNERIELRGEDPSHLSSPALPVSLSMWNWQKAEKNFLERFSELQDQIEKA